MGVIFYDSQLSNIIKESPERIKTLPSYPGADKIMKNSLFLGTYPGLTKEMIDFETRNNFKVCQIKRYENKSSDLIAKISQNKINNIYMVTGGAAMHLNDALGNNKELNIYNLHHEQSCSIAAESHARYTYKPCVVNVTAGPEQ